MKRSDYEKARMKAIQLLEKAHIVLLKKRRTELKLLILD